jgi:hypothetical protein
METPDLGMVKPDPPSSELDVLPAGSPVIASLDDGEEGGAGAIGEEEDAQGGWRRQIRPH